MLTLTGVGASGGWRPSDISGMVFWSNPSNPLKVWQDSAASVQAGVGDTLGAITDQIGGAAFFTQGTGANEPQLVAWSGSKNAVFIADATDLMVGNASVLSASNNVAGWTEAFVVELPPVLGATFTFIRMVTNAGNTKFNVFMDAGLNFGLQTRRINTDTTQQSALGTIDCVGGGRYIVVASVDTTNGAYVVSVNGSITGLGVSGTFTWLGGYGNFENLNAGYHQLGQGNAGTSPCTLASFAEHLAWNRALTATEIGLVANYLNAGHGVY